MGDRANVLVKDSDKDNGVYLYTHLSGTELPLDLQKALAKGWRWNDCQYLTRIIFDTMTEGRQGQETGYGISAIVGDGNNRILEVNCETQTVSFSKKSWTFDEYIKLSDEDVSTVWERD